MVERTFAELKEALRRAGRDHERIGWNGESVNDSAVRRYVWSVGRYDVLVRWATEDNTP